MSPHVAAWHHFNQSARWYDIPIPQTVWSEIGSLSPGEILAVSELIRTAWHRGNQAPRLNDPPAPEPTDPHQMTLDDLNP